MSSVERLAAAFLVVAVPAFAWGNGRLSRSQSAYYCPVAIVCYVEVLPVCPMYAPVYVPVAGQRAPAAQNYARPTAAPPSAAPATAAPPLAPRAPAAPSSDRRSDFGESRSYYDSYAGAPRAAAHLAGDRCQVGFWNLTERDLIIKADGQSRTLAAGKNVQLEVSRQFEWQVDGRAAQRENIAGGEGALEIVIRR
jgi:hypothetical protein